MGPGWRSSQQSSLDSPCNAVTQSHACPPATARNRQVLSFICLMMKPSLSRRPFQTSVPFARQWQDLLLCLSSFTFVFPVVACSDLFTLQTVSSQPHQCRELAVSWPVAAAAQAQGTTHASHTPAVGEQRASSGPLLGTSGPPQEVEKLAVAVAGGTPLHQEAQLLLSNEERPPPCQSHSSASGEASPSIRSSQWKAAPHTG